MHDQIEQQHLARCRDGRTDLARGVLIVLVPVRRRQHHLAADAIERTHIANSSRQQMAIEPLLRRHQIDLTLIDRTERRHERHRAIRIALEWMPTAG
ncbi:MAG: hypothetical protein R3B46_14445 [Phycisphaerales bacterium]